MSDISKINPDNGMNVYDLKDSVCRTALTVTDPTEGNGVITFGVDADGNYGYKKVGADTVTPFKSGGGGVSEFGDNISKLLYYSGTISEYSRTQHAHTINADTDISLSNMSLTKGTWLAILPIGKYTDINMKIKDTSGNYISALSHITADIYNNSGICPNLFIFNLDEDKTINAFQLTIDTAISTFSSNKALYYAYFIKLL